MKHVSKAAAAALESGSSPLDEAIERACANMAENSRRKRAGEAKEPRRPPASGRPPPEARTGPKIAALADERRKRQTSEAETLFRLARKAGVPAELAQQLASSILPTNQTDWPFIMISPQQHADVVRWLHRHSKRPQKATELWAHLFEVLRLDTGEILRSREELALRVGISVDNISEIMGELASINAIRKEKRGRGVRYFMNSNVATHLPGDAARKEARLADGPLLTLMEGGQANA